MKKKCNRCFIQELRKRASDEGKTLIFQPVEDSMGGTNILFVPKNNANLPFYGQETKEDVKKEFFFCWMFQIPENCRCN